MTQDATYLTTPVMRFVMGDAFTGSDKDMHGRPKVDKQGNPKTQWFVGGAIAKNDPGFAELWQQFVAVAQRDFPNGAYNSPGFAWKVNDGDGVNQQGRPYPEHCNGHWIIRMSSGFPPTVYNGLQNNAQITDPSGIKRGDFIRCYINIVGNGDQQKPGLYINHQRIQLVGYGEAITYGPSADEAFGAAPAQLPPGASRTPVATGPMPNAPAPGPGANPMQPAPAPTAPAQAPPAPAASPGVPTASPSDQGVQPYTDILKGPTG